MCTSHNDDARPFRWHVAADVQGAQAASARARLTDTDRARLESLTGDRARRFLRGRALIFDAVARHPGHASTAAVCVRGALCADCGGAHGAPIIDGIPLRASLSHGDDVSVVALADLRLVSAIGIDTEPLSASPERRAAIVSLTGADPATALRHWTRVEAVLKADSRGLRVDAAAVWMSGPRHPHATASATIAGGAPAGDGSGLNGRDKNGGDVYDIYDVDGPAGHVTSVAVRLTP